MLNNILGQNTAPFFYGGNMRKWFVILVLLLPVFLMAAPKFYIASSGGSYKKAVINGILDELGKTDMTGEVGKLRTLKKLDTDAYDVIIIINSVKFGRESSKVRKFLKNADESLRSKIIIVNTAGSSKWKAKKSDLATITTASRKTEIDAVVKNIMDESIGILGLPQMKKGGTPAIAPPPQPQT